MRLCRGNIIPRGVRSDNSLFDQAAASFEDDGGVYDQKTPKDHPPKRPAPDPPALILFSAAVREGGLERLDGGEGFFGGFGGYHVAGVFEHHQLRIGDSGVEFLMHSQRDDDVVFAGQNQSRHRQRLQIGHRLRVAHSVGRLTNSRRRDCPHTASAESPGACPPR